MQPAPTSARQVQALRAHATRRTRESALPIPSNPGGPASVLVVGAGITGLTLAYALQRHGLAPIVVEASDRTGGAIHSELRDGFWLEWGPSTLRGAIPELGWLLEQLHLRDAVVPMTRAARRRYMADTEGHLRALGPSLLPSLAREPRGLWQALRTLLSQRARDSSGIGDSLSLQAWVQSRFGSFAAQTLAQGFCRGLYGVNADEMDARFVLAQPQRLRPTPVGEREMPKSFWLEQGLSRLTDTLAQACTVHTGYKQPLSTMLADYKPAATVLTTSWPAALQLLESIGISAPSTAVHSRPMALHYLAWQVAPWRQKGARNHLSHAFGVVTTRSQARLLGLHIVSNTTPRRAPDGTGLIAMYCQGGTTADQALAELQSLTQITRAPDSIWSATTAHPMPAAAPGYMPHLTTLRSDIARACATSSPIYLAGSFTGGVGVPARIRAALHCAQSVAAAVQNRA